MNIGTPVTKIEFQNPLNKPVHETSDEMKDIEVITLKQYLFDKAADQAWQSTNDIYEIDLKTKELIKTEYNTAKEFVSFEYDKIVVGVNAEKVNEESVRHAFDLIHISQPSGLSYLEFGKTIKVYDLVN